MLLIVAITAKWLLLGHIKPGRYPLWGAYYLRWWFVQGLVKLAPIRHLGGTPLAPLVLRLFGARIGRDVQISTDEIAAFDLIAIGEGSSIDDRAGLPGYTIEQGELVLGPIRIGKRCYVGTHTMLEFDTVMEDGARLDDQSFLPRGSRIPAEQTWTGSPAQRDPNSPGLREPPVLGRAQRAVAIATYATFFLAFPLLAIIAIAPGLFLLIQIDPFGQPLQYVAAIPLVGAIYVAIFLGEVASLKWILLGRVRAGSYPVHGGTYIRLWLVERLLELSIDLVAPLRATLYLAPWFRVLGARVGRSVELSTASTTAPDLITLDDESTVADEVSLGRSHIERGWLTVAPTRLERRAFVGNSAVVPAGTQMGECSLIGAMSVAPPPGEATTAGAGWLGSPPFRLLHWQASRAFSEGRTYRPSRWLRPARASFELLRITLPPAGGILVYVAALLATLNFKAWFGLAWALALLPLAYMAACALLLAAMALAKWLIVGRYRPFEKPLWSLFVWRLELTNALFEFLAFPLALEPLAGTPLLPWYLRLLGCRIGRGVYIDTSGFLEWDLTTIGDRVALNSDCVLQTHLFEDRVLKASTLEIGDDCVVGEYSIVLYDTVIEKRARLDAMSLLMKGEKVPAGTAWRGIPAAWRQTDASLDAAKEGKE